MTCLLTEQDLCVPNYIRDYVAAGSLITSRQASPMPIARPTSMLDGFYREPNRRSYPSTAADHVRTCDQPQDREGARTHRAGQATRYRRRVDRVAAFLMQCECPVMADIVSKSKIERPDRGARQAMKRLTISIPGADVRTL